MSDIALSVHTRLQATAGVTALVLARGYANAPPTNPLLPFYVYHVSSYDPIYPTTGDEFTQVLVEVECVGNTSTQAEAVRNAVRDSLNNFRGTSAGEFITGCTVEGKNDYYIPPILAEQVGWHIHSIDFLVSYNE